MVKVSYDEKTGMGKFRTKCADGETAIKAVISLLVYVLLEVDRHTGKNIHGELLRIVGECMDAMEAKDDEV